MFGSRKDDEKAAKRRIWPWGRRDEQGQSDETVEQPSQTSAEPQVERQPESSPDVNVNVDTGSVSGVVKDAGTSSEEPAQSNNQESNNVQSHSESSPETAHQGEKLGLFARMRQKFEKHSEIEPESQSVEPKPAEAKIEPEENREEKPESFSPQKTVSESIAAGASKDSEIKSEVDKSPLSIEPVVEAESPEKAEVAVKVENIPVTESVKAVVAEPLPEKTIAPEPLEKTADDIQRASGKIVTVAPVSDSSAEPEQSQEPVEEVTETPFQPETGGFFARMRKGLSKTRSVLVEGVTELFIGKKEIDDDLLEELETQLLVADVGVEATSEIIEKLTQRVKYKELDDADALIEALKSELRTILEPADKPLVISKQKTPYVILVVGVNGVGKTTTIGKIASKLQGQGKSVMLAAGDTFRAAAVEQLQVWGERNRIPVIAQHTGADSASVIYDAFEAAKARGADVLIADTAGRLHNKENLMEELKKVKRVLGKLDPTAPHEVLLVLDAGTGQNALSQAKLFHESVGLTGMALTKLDGTAKGGVIFALSRQMQLPIRFLGVGEQIDDLRPFAANEFVDALFDVKDR